MEETESRHAAFRDLLRDVGQQLSQTDISTVEFYENVPPQMKGQSGLMLLDALRKNGKFSPWRIQPLREILRSAGRCDLADDTVKRYQLQFEDKGMSGKWEGLIAKYTLLCRLSDDLSPPTGERNIRARDR